MSRVRHFAIPADNPDRAIDFYRSVFGWSFEVGWEYATPQGKETYWHARTGSPGEPGIDGGLTRREFSGQPITVGIEVGDLEEHLELLKLHGGRVVVPKVALPNVGWFALCQDSEGNSFALIEPGNPG